MSIPKSPTPREVYELKQQAIQYYSENEVPKKIEEILNSMFYDNPDDVFGHMSNYFETFAKTPLINKLSVYEVLDSRGQTTLQANVYCTVKNNEKLVGSEVLSLLTAVPDYAPAEERDAEEVARADDLQEAIVTIKGQITDTLSGLDPADQTTVDRAIYNLLEKARLDAEEAAKEGAEEDGEPTPREAESPTASKGKRNSVAVTKSAGKSKSKGGPSVIVIPDDPLEKFHPGSCAVSVVSAAVCRAAANVKHKPLYQHLAQLHHCKSSFPELALPCPMVTILSSGRCGLGKAKGVKDYMIVPEPGMPAKKSVQYIMSIFNHVNKAVLQKSGIKPASLRVVGEMGGIVTTLDGIDKSLDMLVDAITAVGLTPGQEMSIALNCAGQEIFDHEKGKYEVMTGVQKDAEGVAEFWLDIVTRYPAVIALIDPLRKQECAGWMSLCEKLSDRCLILGDHVYPRAARLCELELSDEFRSSGVVLRLHQMNTVSHIIAAAQKMKDADNAVCVSSCLSDSDSTFICDLAVSLGARFLITGAPSRGERTAKLNRLVQIEAELSERGCLGTMSAHTFPAIKAPTPIPEETEEVA